MNHRPRVLLLIPHLGGGGAEKVFALLAQNLSREKYELHLGVVTAATVPEGAFPGWVTVHALGASRVRAGAFPLLHLVRRLRPQVVVSGMFHLNFLVLLLRPLFPKPTRVIIRQNGTVSAALASEDLPSYTRFLYRLLYRRAPCVICQSAGMSDDLAREIGIRRDRLAILLNPVEVDRIRAESIDSAGQWTGPGPHLLAVGRLSWEKGFDLLLRSLAAVREQFPFADLVIAGSGPEESALKGLCSDLRLEAAVRFAGCVDQPCAYFSGATGFVLSSRHEGMPNALLEAAAGGLPLIALPASDGIRDLLREQAGTWVAADVSSEALTATLLEALKGLSPRQRFSHSFIEEFRVERAIEAYETLIDAAMAGRQP